MKSAIFHWSCNRNCCASCRTRNSNVWAAPALSKWTFGLIAATNRDLAQAVAEKEFRSDLYYRLNVFPIRMPSLSDRKSDIPALVRHFVQKFSRRMNKQIEIIPSATMSALVNWEWPGNVRELENLMERSVILSEGRILNAPTGGVANWGGEPGQRWHAGEFGTSVHHQSPARYQRRDCRSARSGGQAGNETHHPPIQNLENGDLPPGIRITVSPA